MKQLRVDIECKNFTKTIRQIKKLEKAFAKLKKPLQEATKAMNELKEVLPIEFEAGEEEK